MDLNLDAPTWLLVAQRGISIIIATAVVFVVYRLGRRGLVALQAKDFLAEGIRRLLQGTLKFISGFILALIVLQELGVSITSLWAFVSALAAMVAIGFVAVWSVISNALCTVLLIVTKPFNVGDDIAVLDPIDPSRQLAGQVRNIHVFHTVLKEKGKAGTEVLIPNNIFFQKYIRRREGERTFSLEEQLFKAKSLLGKLE